MARCPSHRRNRGSCLMRKPRRFWDSSIHFGTFLVLFSLILALPVRAQFTTTVEGRVSDQTDAAVPGAEVRVENVATGIVRTVRTSSEGYYRVTALPPGTFTLRVTAEGFDTLVQENIALQGDQTKTVNLQL